VHSFQVLELAFVMQYKPDDGNNHQEYEHP
jgi:hypothetical protein